jgi:hypothetical protein
MPDTSGWSDETLAFYRYWESIAPAEGVLPGRQHVRPEDLRKLLPYLWMVDVGEGPRDYRYRLVGTSVVNWVGADYTGRLLREVHADFKANPELLDFFLPIVERHEIHWYRGPPRVAHRKEVAELENLIVPLATDGRTVDIVFGMTLFYGHDGVRIL